MAKKKKKVTTKTVKRTKAKPIKPSLKPKNKKPKSEKPTSKKFAAIASSKKSSGGQAKGKGKDGGTSLKVDVGARHAAGLTAVETTAPRSTSRERAQETIPVSTTSAGISVEAMRNGLAATDQQRVVNNLDRVRGSTAPNQTGHDHNTRNAAFVAVHAGQLENELERGAVALEALRGTQQTKQMMWDLGLARKPRAVTVGRAVLELGAVTEEDAQKARNEQVAGHMNTDDKRHHLSRTILKQLSSSTSKSGAQFNAALAPLLRPALAILQHYEWLRAGRVGVYLVGDGLTEFVDFPQWHWRDEEPEQKLRRPRPRSSRKAT